MLSVNPLVRACFAAFLIELSGLSPAGAGGIDVGGLMGGIGGLMQGAILADQQQKLIERQQQLEQQQYELNLRRQYAPAPNMGLQQAPVSNLPVQQTAPPAPPEPYTYTVDGRRLGEIVHVLDLPNDYRCNASEQFPGYQWCRNSKPVKQVVTSTAIFLSPTDSVVYYSKFFQSADFQTGAVAGEIERLSALHRERARLVRMPAGAGDVDAVIATWGALSLSPVDGPTASALAAGQNIAAGILVDFLGDPRLSAKRGLPIYRLAGGAGFYWVARYDRKGRGTLRYGMCDASAVKVVPPPPPPPVSPPPAVVSAVTPANSGQHAPVPAVDRAAAPAAPNPVSAPTQVASLDNKAVASTTATDAAAVVVPSQGRRVALVIGNSAYAMVPPLENPKKDASAIADTLTADGFVVTRVEDAGLAAMKKALRDFQIEADGADWAMVYYAGHGLELGGINYLIPVDAHLSSDRDVDDEAVTLTYVLDKVRGAKKLHLVVLDACRENPFKSSMARQSSTRGLDSRGLARVEPQVSSELIVYSAKDGEVAKDGVSSGHSPFAQALLARLAMPGVEVNKLFRLVTADVLEATQNHQRPFVYGSSGTDDYYFRLN